MGATTQPSFLVLLLVARRPEHADDATDGAGDHAGDQADLGDFRREHGLAEDAEEDDAGKQTSHEGEDAAARAAEIAVLVGGSVLAAEEVVGSPVADPEGGEGRDDANQNGGLDHLVLFLVLSCSQARRIVPEFRL